VGLAALKASEQVTQQARAKEAAAAAAAAIKEERRIAYLQVHDRVFIIMMIQIKYTSLRMNYWRPDASVCSFTKLQCFNFVSNISTCVSF
jgi:hypothetical protein